MFADLDSLEPVRASELYNQDRVVHGRGGDAACCYARGRYTGTAQEVLLTALDAVSKEAEACDSLQALMITASAGGGTGSGLGSELVERLSFEFPKATLVTAHVMPSSRLARSPTEIYNAVLAMPALLRQADLSLLLDNDAQYRMALAAGFERPAYTDLNRIAAQLLSGVTAGAREAAPAASAAEPSGIQQEGASDIESTPALSADLMGLVRGAPLPPRCAAAGPSNYLSLRRSPPLSPFPGSTLSRGLWRLLVARTGASTASGGAGSAAPGSRQLVVGQSANLPP